MAWEGDQQAGHNIQSNVNEPILDHLVNGERWKLCKETNERFRFAAQRGHSGSYEDSGTDRTREAKTRLWQKSK